MHNLGKGVPIPRPPRRSLAGSSPSRGSASAVARDARAAMAPLAIVYGGPPMRLVRRSP